MSTILLIHSSARTSASVSRLIASECVEHLQRESGPHRVIERDLVRDPVPVLHEPLIHAIRTRPEQLTAEQQAQVALSDELIEELKAANLIVLGAPMYNWNVSAALKAYIDQVIRIGKTFDYGASGPKALIEAKPAIVILSRGGDYDAPERMHLDFQKPYLTTILNLIGLRPTFITVSNTLRGAEALEASLATARAAIKTALVSA